MAEYDYDFFVIGAGSGGVRAGRLAASYGAKVAVAEESKAGGTCVMRGCVPKKFLVYAGQYGDAFEEAAGYGWHFDMPPRFNWGQLIAKKDIELERLSAIYIKNLTAAGAEYIAERAEIVGSHEILLKRSNRKVTAKNILIAVGGWPNVDNSIEGIEHVITSNEALDLPKLPKSIIIAGGGYIALEFASIFNKLGVQVTVIYRGERVLKEFDFDMTEGLRKAMELAGIKTVTNNVFTKIEKLADGTLKGHTKNGEPLIAEQIMFAIGRTPKTFDLGLDKAGVEVAINGAIPVNDYSQTNVPHIYAVGDVTNRINLTPVAIREGAAVAETLFNNNPTMPNHINVASAVFTTPELGTVGMTEAQAIEAYDNVDIYLADFRAMQHAFAGTQTRTIMKLVVNADSNVVLGAHILGPHAGEMIQFVGIAVKHELTKADFDATVAVHPTVAEEMVTMKSPTRQHRKGGKA
jgi:glutathione reductase (NADPH)